MSNEREITREDAIKIFLKVTDQDDPYWEDKVEEVLGYLEDDEWLPTVYEMLAPLGITKEEIERLG